jgi:hypothetical protein
LSYSIIRMPAHGERPCPNLKKYPTEEERREATRRNWRKYYNAHRKVLNAARSERYKRNREAMKAVKKKKT